VRSRNLSVDIARILSERSSEAAEPETHIDAEEARFRLFDSVATLLKEAARAHLIVIILDDLHEADTALLQMLQFVARVLHDANVLIIGTYRDAEMRRSTEGSELMDEIVRDALVPMPDRRRQRQPGSFHRRAGGRRERASALVCLGKRRTKVVTTRSCGFAREC
jgi:hypothetical protein